MTMNKRTFLGGAVAIFGTALATRSIAAPTPIQPAAGLVGRPVAATAPDVVRRALEALEGHHAQIANRDRLGIADFSAHSRESRFHLVDVQAGSIMQSFLVSHGRGSDPANTGFAERFSNVPGSNASSRGSYVTGEEYVGKHGRSRRLHGLEEENDRAFERAIVIHGASYVDRAMAENQGRVGRSLGCFAFEETEIANILELLGPNRLLYAAA